MVTPIHRSRKESRRTELSTEELWLSEDRGIIVCWEVGRDLADKDPELARKAERGELPTLSWKGGVAVALKNPVKYGTFKYLATWQGLRREDLNIDPSAETEITCTRTGVKVIYTPDAKKYTTA